MTLPCRSRGFTLIELLIVVAIIAILAAIAVPNFLEAQTRAKVSRVRADLRTQATALEAYYIDYNKYPCDWLMPTLTAPGDPRVSADSYFPPSLSSPVAYVTSARPIDAFTNKSLRAVSVPVTDETYKTLFYQNVESSVGASSGTNIFKEYGVQVPSMAGQAQAIKFNFGWGSAPTDVALWRNLYGGYKMGSLGPDREYSGASVGAYDPTNGTVSTGDIWRTQKSPEGQYKPN